MHLVLGLWTGQETQGRGRLQNLVKHRIDYFKDGRRPEVRRPHRLQGQARKILGPGQGRGRLQDLGEGDEDSRIWQRRFKYTVGRGRQGLLQTWQRRSGEGEEDAMTWQRRFKDTVGRGRRILQTWQHRSGEGEEDSRTWQRRFKDTVTQVQGYFLEQRNSYRTFSGQTTNLSVFRTATHR
jgi:hypothetical protein